MKIKSYYSKMIHIGLFILILIINTSTLSSQSIISLEAVYRGDRPYIKSMINGKPALFLYDTGIVGMNLQDKFAKEANVKYGAMNKRDTVQICFGGISISTTMYKLDSTFLGGSDYQGIIGASFFKDYIVELDYSNQKIQLYNHDQVDLSEFNKLDSRQIKNNMMLYGFFITKLNLKINDSTLITGNYFIDTGSGRNISVLSHVAFPIPTTSNYITIKIKNASYFGDDFSKWFKIEEVIFNGKQYPGSIIDYGLILNEDFSKNADGIIGGQFLRNFRILIDYKNGYIYVRENSHSKGFTQSVVSTGIGFWDRRSDLGGFVISSIIEKTGFPETDLRIEDLIVEINSRNVMDMSEDEINQIKEKLVTTNEILRFKIKRKKFIGFKTFETVKVAKVLL